MSSFTRRARLASGGRDNTRKRPPIHQPPARLSSIATPPPRRHDQSDPADAVACLFFAHLANDASRALAKLTQNSTTMPKEKSTTATTRTKRATKGEGRKKKGMLHPHCLATVTVLTSFSDPNQPKRGLSAYMFFANEQRDKVREDNPGIKFGMLLPPSLHCHQSTNMLQARSARSSASNGSPSTTSRRSRTMPRPRPTSSVTRRRRPPTLPYVDSLTDHHSQQPD